MPLEGQNVNHLGKMACLITLSITDVLVKVKADSHIACRAHAVPLRV